MEISESLNLDGSLNCMICYFTDSSSIEYEFEFLYNRIEILVLQESILNTCTAIVYTFPIHSNKIHWKEYRHNGNKLPADVINEANNFVNKMVKLKHLI